MRVRYEVLQVSVVLLLTAACVLIASLAPAALPQDLIGVAEPPAAPHARQGLRTRTQSPEQSKDKPKKRKEATYHDPPYRWLGAEPFVGDGGDAILNARAKSITQRKCEFDGDCYWDKKKLQFKYTNTKQRFWRRAKQVHAALDISADHDMLSQMKLLIKETAHSVEECKKEFAVVSKKAVKHCEHRKVRHTCALFESQNLNCDLASAQRHNHFTNTVYFAKSLLPKSCVSRERVQLIRLCRTAEKLPGVPMSHWPWQGHSLNLNERGFSGDSFLGPYGWSGRADRWPSTRDIPDKKFGGPEEAFAQGGGGWAGGMPHTQVATHSTPTLASPTYLDRELENARATTLPLAAPSDATGAGRSSAASAEGAGAAGVDEIRGSRGRLSHEVSKMRGILRQFHKVERKADEAVDSVAAAAARERGGGRGAGAGAGAGAGVVAAAAAAPAVTLTIPATIEYAAGAAEAKTAAAAADAAGTAEAAGRLPDRPAADKTELETDRGSLGATDQTPLWIKWGV